MVVVVVILPIVLSRLTKDGADPCAGRTGDQTPLDAPAKRRAQNRSSRSSNESAFPGTDTALIIAVVIMTVAIVAVVATSHAALCPIVEMIRIPARLSGHRNRAAEQQRSGQ